MEPNQNITLLTTTTDPEDVRVIEWENLESELARLSSLSYALNEAKEKKSLLHQKLHELIQINAESLGRVNELEEMHQKLESKKLMVENMSVHSRLAKEDACKQEEQLGGAIQLLLVAGGGSHSFIIDNAPSIEPTSTSSESKSNATTSTNTKHVEFPLFLEGQETTRAAYAVFLLNKDLEQLLNFIGTKSLGPRHILANLRELFMTIESKAFIDNLI
ncbi:hypothetical protein PIB30_002953 [Stylosanthes scabra]|uniref:Uncharacterized protein n=1 Tax=Stylosanthes scabra TaxID=79078 RepID=A0ABU6V560_9FABA|nr:hypothetical protein [Stylosanthes scabra]